MGEWLYYSIFFEIGGQVDDPHMLIRLLSEHPTHSADRLDRSGDWAPTSILWEIKNGRSDLEEEEITQERAAAFVREWRDRNLLPQIPEDLT